MTAAGYEEWARGYEALGPAFTPAPSLLPHRSSGPGCTWRTSSSGARTFASSCHRCDDGKRGRLREDTDMQRTKVAAGWSTMEGTWDYEAQVGTAGQRTKQAER